MTMAMRSRTHRGQIASTAYGRESWQEAGGVGGLLMVLDGNSVGTGDPTDDDYFPLMDRLGNVTGYRKAITNQSATALDAVFDYDAFGRELRSAGPVADWVVFHFSTKFTDAESGFVNYGYRYYASSIGRWLNRDPKPERGRHSMYAATANDLLNSADFLGLADYRRETDQYTKERTGKTWDFTVKECVVLIADGHGGALPKLSHKFHFPDTDKNSCNDGHAGFMGCHPGATNGGIPDPNAIDSPDDKDLHTRMRRGRDVIADKIRDDLIKSAKTTANGMCQCPCKEVFVIITDAFQATETEQLDLMLKKKCPLGRWEKYGKWNGKQSPFDDLYGVDTTGIPWSH
jgi:RHS repeat-associated protein